ncbi:MAG: PAS domain-containing sensor histidine kinase, partial [Polyangiales bacterium]
SVRDYAIFLLAPDGTILTWNPGAERIKQYSADEIIGRHFSTFYPADDLVRGKPAWELEQAIENGSVEDEGWRIRKDGSRFWADVVITALHDEQGVLRGFAKVTRDLTDRRLSEEALRRSEERFRLLLESVTDYAIFMLDPDGTVATWNNGAQRLKQYTPEEIIGTSFEQFYPPEDARSGKPQRLLQIARERGVATDEGWRQRKDGSRFWGHVVITAVHDEHGKLRGFTKVTRDLTEQRAAEQERERLLQAQEALRLRDEFLSIASHELKTPLTGLQLRLQTMMRRLKKVVPADAVAVEQLEKAVAQGRRLASLIENLLDVSRIATGRMKIQVEGCELGEIVREAVDNLAESARLAECVLHLDVASGIVGVWDRLRLGQVVTNLLSNALKYGAGKPIDVRLESTDEGARLSVSDRGIGVAAEDRERIFGRFERAVPAQNFGGLGLGLYVSQQIVEGHGGRLSLTSDPGVLTRFTVDLPLDASRAATGRHRPV